MAAERVPELLIKGGGGIVVVDYLSSVDQIYDF